ncbi:DCD1_1 [Blepharisma stoltei]|uniref:dCMP deaminase n=1 Tax=Blepharisma stoltei TaxID=1481888 RepID=A0AAU9JHW7_9CILI|nr:unnamed protein product [Blepharisma stoltei]
MIILGITGTLCSGKRTAAEYLQMCYGFKLLDLESDRWDKLANHSKDDYDSEEIYREANAKFALKTTDENIAVNYVVYPITLPEELNIFRAKTNFILLGIDAPALKRFGFYNVKYIKRKSPLAAFLEVDDKISYGLNGYPAYVYECLYSADKIILNRGDKDELYNEIRALDILNPEHLRPSWDTYFMRLAEMAATRTNCMKGGTGAIIVKENRIISTGYNGTPTGIPNCYEGGCEKCNSDIETPENQEDCMCAHSELNAVLLAGNGSCKGATIYSTVFPCLLCTKAIIQSGITRLVYGEEMANFELSQQFCAHVGIDVEKHSPVVPAPISSAQMGNGSQMF